MFTKKKKKKCWSKEITGGNRGKGEKMTQDEWLTTILMAKTL